MCISELSEVLKYELHYDYMKNKYDNKSNLLFTDNDSLIDKDVQEYFSSNKEIFDFSNYSTKSKYYHNSNNLFIDKTKDEIEGAVTEEFVGLKPKLYSFLVRNGEHKKSKGMNRNVVATIIHNEYEDPLLNNKCIRHSMNKIQSKDHRIGTYQNFIVLF